MSDEQESEADQDQVGLHSDFAEDFDWGVELPDVPDEAGDPDVLRFEIGGRSFAVFADRVAEVTTPLQITPIPGLPDYLLGIAVRRRSVVAVLDIMRFLQLQGPRNPPTRFVIIESDGFEVAVGVDAVTGLELWPEDTESMTLLHNIEDKLREFLAGARWAPGGVVVLLDVARVLDLAAVR